jgi:predicted nucleic acid-binding protein
MIVLDTNVLSETMRVDPDRRVVEWIARHDRTLCLATVAVAEIVFGICRLPAGQRSPRWMRRLRDWQDKCIDRTFSFDSGSAEIYGRIRGDAKLAGRPLAPLDAMIAATAIRRSAAVATRNVAHFAVPGLHVIDPWSN